MIRVLVCAVMLLACPVVAQYEDCEVLWEVTMPDGRVLHFEGEVVNDAFTAADGFTDIWVFYRNRDTGRMCCAPGHHWFFTDGFDSGSTSHWSRHDSHA
jgi:hypothetical protein